MADHRWFVDEDQGPTAGGETPADPGAALAEIQRIMGNPAHPYQLPAHPRHEEAVEHVYRLHQIVHPEPANPIAKEI